MTFYAFGVNHLRAPVEIRESFALTEEGKRALFGATTLSSDAELIVLSTCNRTEAYLYGTSQDVARVREALCKAADQVWPDDSTFLFQDEEAVRHVLEVAAGLRSLVLGDAQIFSQLKDAYRIAVEEQGVGTTMHRLMHTAFRAAKRVINETDLTSGAASIPYAAAEAATRLISENRRIETVRALVVGSGSMGRLAVDALRHHGVKTITLTNRSEERGMDVADRAGVLFSPWSQLHPECARHDLVVVATSAEEPVVLASKLEGSGASGTVFVDISVPRNVESRVAELGFQVIDVDGLHQWLTASESSRRTAIPAARKIVGEMLGEFVSWVFHHQALQPVIQTIADTFESIRTSEVDRHHQRFSDVDRAELDEITRSIVQKILAVPVVRLKSVDPESIDFVQGIRLLHALFKRESCDEPGREPHPSMQEDAASGEVREDCPIEPQLTRRIASERISGLELEDVLRLFVMDGGNEAPSGKLENRPSTVPNDETETA